MNKTDLNNLISLGEGFTAEFKRAGSAMFCCIAAIMRPGATEHATTHVTAHVPTHVVKIISALKGDMRRDEIMAAVGLRWGGRLALNRRMYGEIAV